MMERNELERLREIAGRYGVEIRQGRLGQGGFVFDETGMICPVSQTKDLFCNDSYQYNFNSKYSIYDEIMLTAS